MKSSEPIPEDKPIPSEWREAWTVELAQKTAQVEEAADLSLFVFRIGPEWCGIEASFIEGVIPSLTIHRLPARDGGLLGLINFRGKILPCINLSHFLMASAPIPESSGLTVIFNFRNWLFAAPSPAVEGIRLFASKSILPLPSTIDETKEHYAKGVFDWDGKSVIWLDADGLGEKLRRKIK